MDFFKYKIILLTCVIITCGGARMRMRDVGKTVMDSDIESLIPRNYSIHQPPINPLGGPIRVNFSIIIMNVVEISELSQSMALEMNLRIIWRDDRLSGISDLLQPDDPYIILNPRLMSKLWKPDAFFDHTKEIKKPFLISEPASLRMYPNNTLRYSERNTLHIACQMDFHYYPMDIQRCPIDLQSFAYPNTSVIYNWYENKPAYLIDTLRLHNFDLIIESTSERTRNTSSANYSILRFTILLQRKVAYHLIQTYIPSAVFIVVSWLSFLVPPEHIAGRMALSITILLTLSTMFGSVKQSTPSVSYLKALDVWMISCIFFVFLTLFEYTIVLKLKGKAKLKPKSKKQKATKKKKQYEETNFQKELVRPESSQMTQFTYTNKLMQMNQIGLPNGDEYSSNRNYYDNPRYRTHSIPHIIGTGGLDKPTIPAPQEPTKEEASLKYEEMAERLEFYSSFVLPSLFFIFNFIYWPWLVYASNYHKNFNK